MAWREDAHINKLRVGEKGLIATGGEDELTVTGAVGKRCQSLVLNHATVVVAATMDALDHPGLFYVTSKTSTTAHTLTLSNGTFNGTNNVATLDAATEGLLVHFDKAGVGTVILNVGSVALS
jgi:hypothetical protein